MNLLKSIILLTVLSVFISICGAQNKKTKKTLEEKALEMTMKLDKDIPLSKEQKVKITATNVSYLKEKKILDTKIKTIEQEKKKLKKAKKLQIENLLTATQKKKKEELKKKKSKKKKK